MIEKKFKLGDLASLLGCDLKGESSKVICHPSEPSSAGPEDGAVFRKIPSPEDLDECKAGVLIVPSGTKVAGERSEQNLLMASDIDMAFVKFLGLFDDSEESLRDDETGVSAKAVIGKNVFISRGVTVRSGAVIGDGTSIFPGCYIGCDAVIGKNCRLHPNVVIWDRTLIGEDVVIKPGSIIGTRGFGYIQKNGRHIPIPQLGRVRIGDRCQIGANVTIDRATLGETNIGSDVIIDNLVHIAHNCLIGQGSIIVGQVGLSGSVTLGKNVILTGQVGVIDHITVGDNSIVHAQSGVFKNIPANETWFGYPARPSMRTNRIEVLLNRLPEMASRLDKLEKKISEKEQ